VDNSIVKNIFLSLAEYYSTYEHRRFTGSLSNVQHVQRQKLASLLNLAEKTEYGSRFGLHAAMTWEGFSKKIPIVDYRDLAGLVTRQKMLGTPVISGSRCRYYQPTTGMNEYVKWIPFTDQFLAEQEAAMSQILVEFKKENWDIFKGRHFWSVPWYPPLVLEEMKRYGNGHKTDSFLKKKIKSLFMIVPETVSSIESYEGYCLANLSYLASCDDLSLISVWDPAFFLNLIDRLSTHREELAEILWNGAWGKNNGELGGMECPESRRASRILSGWDGKLTPDFTRSMWPRLCMISSWDTGSSKPWIRELLKLFPEIPFQAKGLWATEGVVTIPCEGRFPLAVTSHFYEFLDLETNEIHPPWGLRKGQFVSPVISTGSGLLRYIMRERIEVTGFLDQCPCFHYHGRNSGMDIAGERLNSWLAQKVLDKISALFGINTVSFFAVPLEHSKENRPFYILLCGPGIDNSIVRTIADSAENLLMEHLHYRLARELDQLAPLRILSHPNPRQLYQKLTADCGSATGNIEIGPLAVWQKRDIRPDEELCCITA